MTFPVIEIYCPECKEAMTLVNKPELESSLVDGYDEMVNYHYQCKLNERLKNDVSPFTLSKNQNWCDISKEGSIIIMRILIPSLGSEGSATTVSGTGILDATWIQRGKDMWKQEIKDGEKTELAIPSFEDENPTNNSLRESDSKLSLESLKEKMETVKNLYPNETDYNLALMKAGEKVVKKAPISDEDAYNLFLDIANMINPNNTNKELSYKLKNFTNDCLDEILAEK